MIDNDFITRYRSLPIAYIKAEHLCNRKNYGGVENVMHTSLHNHKELEILYVEDGYAYMNIDGVFYELNKGDILIVNPMEVHYGEFPANQKKFSYFCIDFDISLIKTPENTEHIKALEQGEVKYLNHIQKTHIHNEKMGNILVMIYEALCCEKTGWEYVVRGGLLLFLSVLIENDMMIMEEKETKDIKKADFIRKVLLYIEKHYNEPITSKDLSEELSYNHCYMCRLFKGTFNKSFGDYLNVYRLCRARELLETTKISITEIAALTGFNCGSYFSQMFKKYIGVLPSEYRREQIKK